MTHQHRCPICWEKWHCSDDCTVDFRSLTYTQAECPGCSQDTKNEALRHEFDRFAAFIAAMRDLLRWIEIVSALQQRHDALVDELDRQCECAQLEFPPDSEEVCVFCALRRKMACELQREGELLLAKGAKP